MYLYIWLAWFDQIHIKHPIEIYRGSEIAVRFRT